MLGKIALLQDFQLRHLHIQIHFFLEMLVACGKHFDLRKGESHFVHVLGRTDRAFARHYLADKFLLSLDKLIEVRIKGLFRHITVNFHLWEHIALTFQTTKPLLQVSRSFFADSSFISTIFIKFISINFNFINIIFCIVSFCFI